jgi:hypothetical protein
MQTADRHSVTNPAIVAVAFARIVCVPDVFAGRSDFEELAESERSLSPVNFLIANARLELSASHTKQTPASVSNRKWMAILNPTNDR